MFEAELEQAIKPYKVIALETDGEELFSPSLMSVVGDLNSMHGWTETECIRELKRTTEDNPITLKNGVQVWCEL